MMGYRRSRLRWKYYINTQLKEIGWESMDWTDWLKTRISGWRL